MLFFSIYLVVVATCTFAMIAYDAYLQRGVKSKSKPGSAVSHLKPWASIHEFTQSKKQDEDEMEMEEEDAA